MTIWIILGITILFVILVISLTFWFLVKANKIKPSKVSRLFYYDDESFIKSWEKTKEKGILLYNIKNVIMFTVSYGIIGFFNFSKDNNSIIYWREHILLLVVTVVIFGFLSSLIRWGVEQDRYSKLKEKVKNNNLVYSKMKLKGETSEK
ncbi:hypothetical protein [Clostridium sp.]|uniref:hypothetical protein n=1 Tax=Clostridium sp. TaxID=1506 RepID=UPI001A52C536|nr:hypothetical protein [Clostridium sp.]MBK5241924.1 hypothetical protein [Clostridium sp.]